MEEEASNKLEQIPVINSLRGVAALMVCLYHFVYTTTGYFTNETVLFIFKYCLYGVQLFFVISGIVIPLAMINSNYTYKRFFAFLLKRILRIEPPYLVALVLSIGYVFFRNYVQNKSQISIDISMQNILLHIGYLVPFVKSAVWINPVFWTLAIEFQYYLFLALLFPLVLHKIMWQRFVFYAIVFSFPFLNCTVPFFPFWGCLFLLGILYVLWQANYIRLLEYIVISIIAAIIVFVKIGIPDLVVAIITIALVHFAKNKVEKIGLFFGKISYSIYLVHCIVGSAFVNICSHKFTASYQKPFVVLGGLLVSILCAYIMYFLVEKPSHNMSKKVGNFNNKL